MSKLLLSLIQQKTSPLKGPEAATAKTFREADVAFFLSASIDHINIAAIAFCIFLIGLLIQKGNN